MGIFFLTGSELNLFNDDKMSPLDKAVANYQIDAVDLLIKHGQHQVIL